MPVAQRRLDLVQHGGSLHRADQDDDHALGRVAAPIEVGRVVAAQARHRVLVTLDAAAIGMIGVEQSIERQVGHAARVVRPPLQVGEDLPPQPFCFVGRKDRMSQAVGQDGKEQVQVLSQRLAAESGGVHAAVKAQLGADRLERLVDLAERPGLGAAQEHRGGQVGQTGLLGRFAQGTGPQIAAQHYCRAVVVLADQEGDAVGQLGAGDRLG